ARRRPAPPPARPRAAGRTRAEPARPAASATPAPGRGRLRSARTRSAARTSRAGRRTCRRRAPPHRARSPRARAGGRRGVSRAPRLHEPQPALLLGSRLLLRRSLLCRLLLGRAVERDQEVVPVRRRAGRNLPLDLAGENELDQRLVEGLHLEEGAVLDRGRDPVDAV